MKAVNIRIVAGWVLAAIAIWAVCNGMLRTCLVVLAGAILCIISEAKRRHQ